jgi:hypothetical protein
MRYILEQNNKVLTVGTSIFEVSDEIKPPILNLNAETLLLKPNGDARINSDPISIWYSNNMQGISAQQPEAAKQPLFRPNAINGFPAIEFPGAYEMLLQTGATAKTLFFVARYLDAAPTYVGPLFAQSQVLFRSDHQSSGNFFFANLQGQASNLGTSWLFNNVRLYVGGNEVAPPSGFPPRNFYTVICVDVPATCNILQLGHATNTVRFQMTHLSIYDYRMKFSDRVSLTNALRTKYAI